MERTVVSTPNAPAAIGPYSQGIVAQGTMIFTAGQVGFDPASGALVAGDVKAQTRRALENVKAILEKGGATLQSVVKTTVFLKEMGEFAAMNEVYAEFFPAPAPARSTVEVSRLPRDARVEIEAIAVVERR
jgi:2-iminobutanoate/2-iminopropanoate deaminase